jgi:hypothetical protein
MLTSAPTLETERKEREKFTGALANLEKFDGKKIAGALADGAAIGSAAGKKAGWAIGGALVNLMLQKFLH